MAADALARIAAATARRVERLKTELPPAVLRADPLYEREPRSLAKALSGAAPRVIAEVKFASPSAGVLRAGAAPGEAAKIAASYAKAGAAAVSILTEPEFFGGDHGFLAAARERNPELCLLMKDFFLDAYQLELARACGADAVLLIAAMVGPSLGDLLAAAHGFGLSALVEVHDEAEAEAALEAGAEILGVNSRDLKTLKTDLDVARRLAPYADQAGVAVAESGLNTRAEIDQLIGLGYKGFLVGASLMKERDPGAALKALLSA